MLIQTLSSREQISLGDPRLHKAAEGADVFLDTAVRFMNGSENDPTSTPQICVARSPRNTLLASRVRLWSPTGFAWIRWPSAWPLLHGARLSRQTSARPQCAARVARGSRTTRQPAARDGGRRRGSLILSFQHSQTIQRILHCFRAFSYMTKVMRPSNGRRRNPLEGRGKQAQCGSWARACRGQRCPQIPPSPSRFPQP